jgi:hypothetical protein
MSILSGHGREGARPCLRMPRVVARIGWIAVALLVGGSCGDVVTSRYETRAAAEADRLFERGWLPAILPQEGSGDAGFVFGDLLRGAAGDELAAFGSGFGADVDEVVGFGEDVGVMLDDDDGVAFIDEAMQDVDEAGDIGDVQADGGLFDEVEVLFSVASGRAAFR